MLLCTKTHFIRNIEAVLNGKEGSGNEQERKDTGTEMSARIQAYASDESGNAPGPEVYLWTPSLKENTTQGHKPSLFSRIVQGRPALHDQRIIYVDGGWDLFSCGHIEFLRLVVEHETSLAHQSDWHHPSQAEQRVAQAGWDYPPFFVVAGIHEDEVINYWKGVNYPIMNLYERLLCLLPCRYINAVVVSAPFVPNREYLSSLPYCQDKGLPDMVYHGPTQFTPLPQDPYADAKELSVFHQIGDHNYADLNAASIVERILKGRAAFEERQRVKGVKGLGEEAIRTREEEERKAEKLTEHRREEAKEELGIRV